MRVSSSLRQLVILVIRLINSPIRRGIPPRSGAVFGMYHFIRFGMMSLTKTALGMIDWTELEPPTATKSHEFLIRIIALARLKLDRLGDGVAIVVFRPPIAHDGETQRSIHRWSYCPAIFGEFLIFVRRAMLDNDFIAFPAVAATATF